MPISIRFTLVIGITCAVAMGAIQAEPLDTSGVSTLKTLTAVGWPDAPREFILDGRLTEPAWARAPVGDDVVERVPNPRDVPPVGTRVRVLKGPDALYVAVESDFAPQQQPRAFELRRDSGRVWSDDAITLKFDITLDRRTTLIFATNRAGTQVDAIALNNGRQFRKEFDAVWYTASHFVDGTWTVEYKLPYTALGLTARAGARIVGFNVTRDHNRRNATYDWSHLPPEFGAMAASHFGQLGGLEEAGRDGYPFRILPFVLAKHPGDDAWSGSEVDVRAGSDFKLRMSTDLWAELTVLTDFAEVDLDDEIVNLSRFPLFLPEKRPFFLSGLNIFEFGARGQSQIFFSRRIGIDQNANQIPIWAGAKMYGEVGRIGVGVLNVMTDSNADQPLLNDTVARLRYTTPSGSTLGAIVASRNSLTDDPSTRHQHSAGVDGAVRFLDRRLELGGFAAVSIDQDETSELGNSQQLYLEYRGGTFQPKFRALRVSETFSPSIGFVRRSDVIRPTLDLPVILRFKESPVANIVWRAGGGYTIDGTHEDYLGFESEVSGRLNFRMGWALGLTAAYLSDVIDEAFSLQTGQTIAPGTYEGPEYSLFLRSPYIKNPSARISYALNQGFYGGDAHTLDTSISSYLTSHLRIAFGIDATWFKLPDDDTWTDTIALNESLTVAFNTRLFWETNIQVNTVSDLGRVLSRIRWRYLPGSDLFFVYQEDRNIENWSHLDRRIAMKATYWWDN
ncbi:MAG: DUF5916 domain-containing protein [Myxococcota bacterium]|nr:DUF5916 domain-containing protein [Myxococcota bacterium]